MINQPHFSDEEEIARLVNTTLQTATQTNNLRLKQLMPEIPQNGRRRRRLTSLWGRQFAAICTAVLFCLSLYGFYQSNQPSAWQPPAGTSIAITATFTSEPTATDAGQPIVLTETAVAIETQAALNPTPAPPATPIAALFDQNLLSNTN